MLRNLVLKNRSYRRFYEYKKISLNDLRKWVDLARLSASGRNLQPLKFGLSNKKNTNKIIFKNLAWAGYLKDWDGPIEGERPSAYIIILGAKKTLFDYKYDVAIACQSILLGAVENGFGGCIIGSMKKNVLLKELNISTALEISLVIALGKPKEKVIIEPVKNNDIKYWRDENGIHHVPKRNLDDLIIKF